MKANRPPKRERGANYGNDSADKFIGSRLSAPYPERYSVKRVSKHGTVCVVEYFRNLPQARDAVNALLQYGGSRVINRRFHPK